MKINEVGRKMSISHT